MNKNMIRRIIETLMERIVGRPVSLTFSHLGQDQDYTVAIQTSLYEFDEQQDGPMGPMYLAINMKHLHDADSMSSIVREIAEKYGA
tara:strand:- start:297 stop:554 length:258 start_codon:yes stop_codon:yes gene_type:complete